MADDPEAAAALRRSKRNKFHLNIAAIHSRARSPALQVVTVMQPGPSSASAASSSAASASSSTATAVAGGAAAVAGGGPTTSAPTPTAIRPASRIAAPATSSHHPPQIVIVPVAPGTSSTTHASLPGNPVTVIKKTFISSGPVRCPSAPLVSIVPKRVITPKSEPGGDCAVHSAANAEALGKRKRKAAVCDDFSYSVDSEEESDQVNAVGVEYTTETCGIKGENEFPCPRCPALFETRVGLTNHLKLHGANKTFPCHSCDFSCTNRKTMRQHKKVHGQLAPLRKRKPTDNKKNTVMTVEAILRSDGKKLKPLLPCPWCPYKTHSMDRLLPHKLAHFKAHGYQCPECEFRAESRPFLKVHLALHGKDALRYWPPAYVCADAADLDPLPIKIARAHFHPERRLLSCTECEFETRLRLRFERHLRKKHNLSLTNAMVVSTRRKSKDKAETAANAPAAAAPVNAVVAVRPRRRFKLPTPACLKSLPAFKAPPSPRKTCPYCGRHFATEGHYRVHYALRHFSNRRSERPQCIAMFNERLGKPEFLSKLTADISNPSEVLQHLAAIGPQAMFADLMAGTTGWRCSECPYSTDNKTKMTAHSLKHNVKFDFACSKCSYSCKVAEMLVKHEQLHDDPAPHVDTTTLLPKLEIGDKNGDKSASKKSVQENSLRCPNCPYRSKHGCDMKAHQKMHGDRGTFRCPYCTYSTMRLNALKSHIALHEEDKGGKLDNSNAPAPPPDQPMVQKLPEKDRGNDFVPKDVVIAKLWDDTHQQPLGRKMVRMNGAIFYRCAQCPFEGQYPSTLNQHFRHHIRVSKYKCPKCTFSTDRDDILPKHIDSHQNEPAPEGGWFCSACPYRADSYGKQWHHVQKHKKVGRFNCEICKFGVGSIQSFNDHMLLHGIVVGPGGEVPVAAPGPSAAVLLAKGGEHISSTSTDISSGASGDSRTPSDSSAASTSSEKDKSEERSSTTSSLPGGVAIAQDFEMDMDWSGTSSSTFTPTVPPTAVAAIQTRAHTSSPAAGPTTRGKTKTPVKKQLTPKQLAAAPIPVYKHTIALALPPVPSAIRPKRRRQGSENSSSQPSLASEEEEKVHECKHCPFTCLDAKMLKFHARMHSGDRPHKCAMCTFSCFNIDALYSHMNVHAPQLPEAMLATMKKKLAQRRRNGSLHERETLPANAANVFQCQQCSFRTAYQDRFLQHRMEHVQHLQQRLMTQMKRAANDDRDGRKSKLLARKKIERKWNYCTQCSFRCDTLVALMNHQEFHGSRNNVFQCRYCNYGANSRDVVSYHENTHHMDLPATNQSLNLVAVNGIVDDDLVSEIRQKYTCGRCSFSCHELADYIGHFEAAHVDDPQLQEAAEKLRMGLLPNVPFQASIDCS